MKKISNGKWDCKRETGHCQYLEKYFNIFTKEKFFYRQGGLKKYKTRNICI